MRPPKEVDASTFVGRFAARLRVLRNKRNMTVEQAAEAITNAGVHCNPRAYYRWESGKHPPGLEAIPAIAEALQVSIRSLFPTE